MIVVGTLNKLVNKILSRIVKGPISKYLKISSNKVVAYNFFGNGYGDNPKYIIEKLLESKQDLDIIWIVSDVSTPMPNGIRKVKYGSFQSMYELATAKVIIGNIKNFPKPRKKRGQFYLQTWHAGLGLKSSERQIEDSLPPQYVEAAKRDAAETDLMLSDSQWTTDIYKNWFWYDSKIYKSGFPRNDILVNKPKQIIEKVYAFYNIKRSSKIVLYAPTFRDSNNTRDLYSFDFKRIKEILDRQKNEDYVFLIRLHPNLKHAFKRPLYEFDGQVMIDAQNYPDMQELIVATDILITDYSSSMFDAMIAEKRVFLLARDLGDFEQKDRKLLFDLKNDVPFSFSSNENELIEIFSLFDENEYKNRVKAFEQKIELLEDGNASRRVAKLIEDRML